MGGEDACQDGDSRRPRAAVLIKIGKTASGSRDGILLKVHGHAVWSSVKTNVHGDWDAAVHPANRILLSRLQKRNGLLLPRSFFSFISERATLRRAAGHGRVFFF